MYRVFGSDNATQDGHGVSCCRVPSSSWKAGFRFLAVRLLSNSALIVLSLRVAPHSIYGQVTNVTNGQQFPTPGVGHDYIGTINEVVTPANGSLSIRIPLPAPPGRGVSLPVQFTYNSDGIIQAIPLHRITIPVFWNRAVGVSAFRCSLLSSPKFLATTPSSPKPPVRSMAGSYSQILRDPGIRCVSRCLTTAFATQQASLRDTR
jgi:hypothetical protein